jgi:hypothetical protein
MNIKELRSILERLQEIFAFAGNRQSANDLRSVVEALGDSEDKTVEGFVSETKSLMGSQSVVLPETYEAGDGRVAYHLRKLLDAKANREAFESALGAIQGDARVSKEQLFEIANGYFNEPTGSTHVFKFKTKAAAYEFIRRKFVERAQRNSKFKILEKIGQSR